jgi:hypothetical protein
MHGEAMPDKSKPISERARKRTLGTMVRERAVKRQEAFFELLVSGYTIEQIATSMKQSRSTVRRTINQALAKRRFDSPEDYARIQVARLTKALRCADASLEEGDVKAIAPFLGVLRELNLYHGVRVGRTELTPAAAVPELPPPSPPLALTHAPGLAVVDTFGIGNGAEKRTQAIEIV